MFFFFKFETACLNGTRSNVNRIIFFDLLRLIIEYLEVNHLRNYDELNFEKLRFTK